MVDLGINDNMIDWIERFGSVVRLTAESRPGVFGGKICPNVRMGVVDNLDRARACDTFNEEAQVFPSEIVGFACSPWEMLRVQGMVAILLIFTGADLVDLGDIPRSDKKSTTLFRIGLSGMGVDFSQRVARDRQGCSVGMVCL
jgi:hypothetical protein